jgi:diacylglycerol kinase family enzyme
MLATLIYNPLARGAGAAGSEALLEALAQAGFEPRHLATESEADLDEALRNARGLIVVAGGDGTFRAVATRVLGLDVQLAIVPMGTANNIARTLGITGSPQEVISGLSNPRERLMDVGQMRTPWGDDCFLEGAGFGLFAETLAQYNPEEGKSIVRALRALTETLATRQPHHFHLTLDGRDISGPYLMVEALNTTAIGTRLKLAPHADPSDGLLEIVRVREELRPGLLRYAAALVREELDELPAVEVERGRRLVIAWDGFPIHVDAIIRPGPTEAAASPRATTAQADGDEAMVVVEVMPGALKLWLPQSAGEASP